MSQILVVEDEKSVRAVITEILSLSGHIVIEAAGGREGIKLYHEHPADLVITDLLMPEVDGLDLIMELRQSNPQAKIIAMSGGGILDTDSYLEIAEKFGACCGLSKPFTAEELINLVQKVLAE